MKTFTVKDVEIGRGQPKIVSTVREKNMSDVMEAVRDILRSPADIVEIRLDVLENQEKNSFVECLEKVRGILGEIPLMVTLRTDKEGGYVHISDEEYHDRLTKIAQSGKADLIDVESSRAGDMIPALKKQGMKVVLAHYDFEKMPSEDEIIATLQKMEEMGADLARVFYEAKTREDTEKLLKASKKARLLCNIPIAAIAMGKEGVISLVSGQVYGSSLTFSIEKNESTPEKTDAAYLKRMMNGIHRVRQSERAFYLIGFAGSGKSAIGREIGRLTGQIVYDMDELVEKAAGCSIKEIIAIEGEEGVKKRENDLLKYLTREKGSIISCGSALLKWEENRRLMHMSGDACFLQTEPETILKRIENEKEKHAFLPENADVGNIEKAMAEMKGIYENAADMTVKTDEKDIMSLALEIIDRSSLLD